MRELMEIYGKYLGVLCATQVERIQLYFLLRKNGYRFVNEEERVHGLGKKCYIVLDKNLVLGEGKGLNISKNNIPEIQFKDFISALQKQTVLA